MLQDLKNLGRAIIPTSLFKLLQPIYHGFIAYLATLYFGNPSKDVFVIAVTGTAGKSTTVMMLSHLLNSAGQKTGYITTVGTFDGELAKLNKHGLSMPGGWLLQKTLHEFALKGCKNVIIECTSEGLAQNRHLGIKFEAALFTNLSPAHLDSHGSFENYRAAKTRAFQALHSHGIIGVNADDPNYNYFFSFPSRKKFAVTTRTDQLPMIAEPLFVARDINVAENITFNLEGQNFTIKLKGSFNVSNALLAIGLSTYLGVSLPQASQALSNFGSVPGRMEVIPNKLNATIIVDYAPEPAAMEASLRAAKMIPHKRLIHVFGSTGGHRDVSKRFEFGRISARWANIIIITNDDVYDSDPQVIAQNVKEGIDQLESEYKAAQEVMIQLDRKSALEKAVTMLEPEDLLLVTGKGSEQFLVLPGNQRIAWDEREVIKNILQNI